MPPATGRRTSGSSARSPSTTAARSRCGSATRTTSSRRGAAMRVLTAFLVAALAASLHAQQPANAPAAPPKPTPRAADGRPDLSGIWIAGNRGIRPSTDNSSIKVVLPLDGVNQDKDNVFAALDRISVAERAKAPNKPPYKPELAAKLKDLETRQSQEDPAFYCKPA